MNIMSNIKRVVKWHGKNGTSLRKFKSKSDSNFEAKRKFGPKKGGKQGELAGMHT
jgi:hypothetical protein